MITDKNNEIEKDELFLIRERRFLHKAISEAHRTGFEKGSLSTKEEVLKILDEFFNKLEASANFITDIKDCEFMKVQINNNLEKLKQRIKSK